MQTGNNREKDHRQNAAPEVDPEEFVENAGEPEEIILEEAAPEPDPQQEDADQRLMRLRADYDNYRRRTAKESAQQQQRGRREAAAKLLPVIDSLSMALLSIPADNPARTGIDAVMRQAIACFEDLGIRRIPTRGETFDPELHEAIGHLPHPEFPEGIICEESRAGFVDELGLLRPAQVLVSAGNGG